MDIFAGDKGGGGGAGECCFQTMQTPRETVTPYQFKKKERQKEKGLKWWNLLWLGSFCNK